MPTLKVGILTKTSPSRHIRTQGFTFIELLVVLVILSVCTTLVFPKMDRLLVWEAEPWKSGRQLIRAATHAHECAIATESMVCLYVDVPAGKYWVSGLGDGSMGDSHGVYQSLKGKFAESVCVSHVEMPGEEPVLDDTLCIRFSPDGWSEPVRIVLSRPDEANVAVVIGECFGDIELVSSRSAG